MTLNELAEIDTDFANAIKMLVIKANLDGNTTLPMNDLVDMLNRLGFAATGQEAGIRDYVATLKNKSSDMIADVSDDEIMFTTMPKSTDSDEESEDDVKRMAVKQARKELGL